MTLVELLVVAAVLSGLMIVVFTVLVTVIRQSGETARDTDAVDQARLAVSQLDRQVRSGEGVFLLGDGPATTRVAVLSRYDLSGTASELRCVEWRVSGGESATGSRGADLETRSWPVPVAGVVPVEGVTSWRTTARGLATDQKPFSLRDDHTLDVDIAVDRSDSAVDSSDTETSMTVRNANTTGATCLPAPAQ